MTVEGERARILAWEGCYNVRDLGGYPTTDGRETRWGAIVRSDALSRLTPAGCDALIEYGVRTIVDLRRPVELSEYPNPFAPPNNRAITYVNLSLIDPTAAPPSERSPTMADDYKRVLARFDSRIGDVMTTIAHAREGTVLVHCAGGKDRSGLVAALLLALARVDIETIAADYAISDELLRPRNEAWLRNASPEERAERERSLIWSAARAEVMLDVLAHIDDRYDGVEAYLRSADVQPENLARLRGRLLA